MVSEIVTIFTLDAHLNNLRRDYLLRGAVLWVLIFDANHE